MLNTSTSSFNKTLPLFSLPKPFITSESKQNGLHKSAEANKASSVDALSFRKQLCSDAAAVTRPRRQSRRRNGVEVRAVASRLGVFYPFRQQTNRSSTLTVTISLDHRFGDLFFHTKPFYLKLTSVSGKELEEHAYRIWSLHTEFSASFKIRDDFGDVGVISITNEQKEEVFIQKIVLASSSSGCSEIICNSWLHSKYDNPEPRVFFTHKPCLPSQTPKGLDKLRKNELHKLRGDGKGERQSYDRIYDYDTYNDLGDPKTNHALKRPTLGGNEHPYPRRCRTGREQITIEGETFETRSANVPYVPRDETFSSLKSGQFAFKKIYSVLHALIPLVEEAIEEKVFGTKSSHFPYFTAIELLYDEGINLPIDDTEHGGFLEWLHSIISATGDIKYKLLCFELPEIFKRDRFSWLSDKEFARQTLAGMNPLSIKRVTNWPLKSNLDPATYGKSESALTKELVEREMNHCMTVEEAIEENRLFIIDYHDALLPYVNKVRKLESTTLYGSRTLFFLDDECKTLKPLAIELTRPKSDVKPQWKEVYTPGKCATSEWLWNLAKVHVLAHDTGYHQLISHWLRTHCCMEPYIIAANRYLSAMHPIYKLLHPHFRYTLEINALARQSLINAGGVIETTFSPGEYSLELSSYIYDKEWRFDHEALPADLISRGMAVEDPSAPHGIKLVIDDYPYAKDGLDLWAIIKEWVTRYVNHYYPNPNLVEKDDELQNWWEEVRTKGHGDKKDEPWWPNLKTPEDLIQILTTIIWIASGHHSAVNFGQYHYGGYFPNRPTIARTTMPNEDPVDDHLKSFIEKPEDALLRCFPSPTQATKVMLTLDTLSAHSPDEEYLGAKPEPSWNDEPKIKDAFETFDSKLKALEDEIDKRNGNKDFKNRNGVGVVPYEFFKRQSECGITGKGVPNSISI
ncbi:linoleate 13S-lipoxygenase 2-1, chloroplastic-like [Chenopodium quinoa]|uniref:Lipoxygenase n=1 Tax=Chenopodium quinoa TaxID=63459 RepID=A0A803KUV9_CHEQI|nr:linoleate 13S-lipoxygenase 2-1, chloroplastic-like [Chenopodium quinoa]